MILDEGSARCGVSQKTVIACIAGNVGSRVFGAWPTPGTKSQDVSASTLRFFFYYLYLVSPPTL